MGLKFIVSEAQERVTQATQANNHAQQAAAALQQSIQHFLAAPLSSKAYDSAKNYFIVAYTPIRQSIIMTGEALLAAHKKFLSEYQATVSGLDMDEDELLAEIEGYEDLLRAFDELIRQAKTPRPDLEKRAQNAFDTMQKRQEKLEKFRAYSARSAGFFSEYESSQQELNSGLAQVKDCKAWNASTGTFDISRLDMNWAKPINDRWKDYQDKKNGIDPDKNKALKKYTLIRCYDEINDRTTWSIEDNGKRLDDPALQAYLKKVGKYLSDKDYTILSLTPKEWETRINNQWKQGTEYFNGTKVSWAFQGLGHIQDYVQKRQNDGTWDAMWSLGFTFANIRNTLKWSKQVNELRPGRTFKSKYDIPVNDKGYTKSSLKLGREVHKEYKVDSVNNATTFKEYTLPSGKRVDFIDFETKTIYELKPHNPNQISAGTKQLQGYLSEVESVFGGTWNVVLDTY